jgi:hypothetical protein
MPLVIPESGRYFSVDLSAHRSREIAALEEAIDMPDAAAALATVRSRPARPLHHFRLPTPSRLRHLLALRDARPSRGGVAEFQAAAVGVCWFHRSQEIQAVFPADPTPGALVDYAEAVQLELLDAGYTEREIGILCERVIHALAERQIDGAEAGKIAAF